MRTMCTHDFEIQLFPLKPEKNKADYKSILIKLKILKWSQLVSRGIDQYRGIVLLVENLT